MEREKGMADMSPLGRFVLRLMRAGSLASAVFLVLVMAVEVWKLWRFGEAVQNAGFLAVLAVMLVGFLWLARSISRELARHGS